MGRVSHKTATKEGARRLVGQWVRVKRLRIEKALKRNPDAVNHVFDVLRDLNVISRGASDDEASDGEVRPSSIPASELATRKKEQQEQKAKLEKRERISSKWLTVAEISTRMLQKLIISLRPQLTSSELGLHFSHRGRPEVTKSSHLQMLESMIGKKPETITLTQENRFLDGLMDSPAIEHAKRGCRFANSSFLISWPRDGLYGVQQKKKQLLLQHKLLMIEPRPFPNQVLQKLFSYTDKLIDLGFYVDANFSETGAIVLSSKFPQWGGLLCATLFPDPLESHTQAIKGIPRPPEPNASALSLRRRQRGTVIHQLEAQAAKARKRPLLALPPPPAHADGKATPSTPLVDLADDDENQQPKKKIRTKKRRRPRGSCVRGTPAGEAVSSTVANDEPVEDGVFAAGSDDGSSEEALEPASPTATKKHWAVHAAHSG